MSYILALLEEARRIAHPAADELADFVEHVLEHGPRRGRCFNLSDIASEEPRLGMRATLIGDA